MRRWSNCAPPRRKSRLRLRKKTAAFVGFGPGDHMFEKYQPIELSNEDNVDSKQTRSPPDRRLSENAEVLGVSAAGTWKAYPVSSLPKDGGVIHDTLAGQDIVIFWYPATRTAVAYASRLDGTEPTKSVKLEFDAAEPAAPFIDRESGSRFGIEGRAVSGPLKGETLTWIDSVQCKWFAWAAENPETAVYGVAKDRPIDAAREKHSATSAKRATELVFVVPDTVRKTCPIANWQLD